MSLICLYADCSLCLWYAFMLIAVYVTVGGDEDAISIIVCIYVEIACTTTCTTTCITTGTIRHKGIMVCVYVDEEGVIGK